MAIVRFGNAAPLDHATGYPHPGGPRITTAHLHQPTHDERVAAVIADDGHLHGLWVRHSGASPSWVASDDPALAAALAAHYGCPVGEPTEEDGR